MHVSDPVKLAGGGLSHSNVHIQDVKNMTGRQASFETTSRLLSSLVNEGLVQAIVTLTGPTGFGLRIEGPGPVQKEADLAVWVGLAEDAPYDPATMTLPSLLHPDDLRLPVVIVQNCPQGQLTQLELGPGAIFDRIYQCLGGDESARSTIIDEIDSLARNQG